MTKITIQLIEHLGKAERIWTDEVSYIDHGILCYEKDKPTVSIFIPYTSIRMITRMDV